MYTRLQVVNHGLRKLGASPVSRLDPPSTSLERHVADGYPLWLISELAKRRWVFATEHNYTLAKVDTLTNVDRPHKYQLPAQCLRPLRSDVSDWVQSGRYLYSAYTTLKISMIVKREETEFDPLFVEVFACRIATECVEFTTQSNTKADRTDFGYEEALTIASRANAFTIGPENLSDHDEAYDWITERY
jgi:hypothetical protein